jgi:hypothetical protein
MPEQPDAATRRSMQLDAEAAQANAERDEQERRLIEQEAAEREEADHHDEHD